MASAFSKRTKLAIAGTGIVCVAIVFEVLVWSGGMATIELLRGKPTAVETAASNYRRAGLPWTAKDLAIVPPVKDEENAAPILLQACALYDSKGVKAENGKLVDAALALKWPEVDRLLKPRQEILTLCEKALKRPRVDFHRDWDEGPLLYFPEYVSLKEISRNFCYRASLRASRGDLDGCCSDLQTSWKLSDVPATEPYLISFHVSRGLKRITWKGMRVAAVVMSKNEPALRRLVQLGQSFSSLPDFRLAMRGESYQELAMMRNIDLFGDSIIGSANPKVEKPDSRLIVRGGIPSSRKYKSYIAAEFRALVEIDNQIKLDPNPLSLFFYLRTMANRLPKSEKLQGEMITLYADSASTVPDIEAEGRTTQAMIDAMHFKITKGRFPESIEELGSNWIDPFTSRSLKYLSRKDGFSVYSLGLSRRDDGGITRDQAKAMGKTTTNITMTYRDSSASSSGSYN